MLYKCIPFSKNYWSYIVKEQKIRFATVPELLNGNDKEEFDHRWDSKSQFFKKYSGHLSLHYDSLFSKAVILSLGKSPNERCWREYCGDGGVRYEFEYDDSHSKISEVTCGDVIYDNNKTFNLPAFLISREPCDSIKRLLQMENGLSWNNWAHLWLWLQRGTPNRNSLEHIKDELVFKKIKSFIYEDEYRFIHLIEQIGPNALKLVLENQKVLYEKIGLKLVRISTSDIETVKREIPCCGVDICEVYFEN